ncbi:nitroreductase family protein [Microbacterium xanthum]|uniref:nitroreductase family protein n=1 Tax=Microbacterium xanthum TaxID=3079794 RepID=UPI002AD1E73F|nr:MULTISPECIES: nitroreductase family protein [unclassified Microbacterium]MDZ8172970.1 nitroreductase family protein [Microbacterium sp. KSW-48]MDZ8200870.1 nitroreductase family protein [Microbacterium sp. SSW1-59]
MTLLQDRTADTDHPVLDVIAERWSTRVFDTDTALDDAALAAALEAARWAPSANNSQPWRFIVARRGSAPHATLVDALGGFNKAWARDAGALVVFVAETAREDGTPQRWAEYDTGQASAYFSLQAHASGLATHQMGGFDHDAVARAFELPENLEPVTIIAVGTLGSHDGISNELRQRENAPRTRRALEASVIVDA